MSVSIRLAVAAAKSGDGSRIRQAAQGLPDNYPSEKAEAVRRFTFAATEGFSVRLTPVAAALEKLVAHGAISVEEALRLLE